MIIKRFGTWALRSTTLALTLPLLGLGMSAPASAGTCTTQGCGGEVTNNSSMPIRITNCWSDSYGASEEGDKLGCVKSYNVNYWFAYNSDVELPAHDESKWHFYYYDTDAFRAYRGCVTKYHYWGAPTSTADRRGKASLWIKITNLDHVYIDSISC
ncbi:hypothetical protein [Streptomyces sp. NPDC004629]|uniref:hypothetical protein n=1 Tax=Streptomyces sp. NPDC004629 TaxID=3364705 RepID=UPI0036B99A64